MDLDWNGGNGLNGQVDERVRGKRAMILLRAGRLYFDRDSTLGQALVLVTTADR